MNHCQLIISEKSRRRGTYNAVVGAADGVGVARVASNTNDGDGAALNPDEGIDGTNGDTEEGTDERGELGVVRLQIGRLVISLLNYNK